jgi:hypothetical protein
LIQGFFDSLPLLARLVLVLSVVISGVSCHRCFDTKFPRILGGTQGDTVFYAFDIDQAKNIVIGGHTSDPGIANLKSSADPIALMMETGGRVKWA